MMAAILASQCSSLHKATCGSEVMQYGAAATSEPVFKPPPMAYISFLTVYLISSDILFGSESYHE